MIHLNGNLKQTWNAPTFVGRLTTDLEISQQERARSILLLEGSLASSDSNSYDLNGFAAILVKGSQVQGRVSEASFASGERWAVLPRELEHLKQGDVIRLNPSSGKLNIIHRIDSGSNIVFMTERCNSNCLMCSQPPRDVDDRYRLRDYLEAIPLMDANTVELGITGGEPGIYHQELLSIIAQCKEHLPKTSLHMLSNGRLFSYLQFALALGAVAHHDLMVGIPLYSDIASLHDYVVQAQGAFDQTIRGIINLARAGVAIEIRVVVHQQTWQRLVPLAQFIARNLPFVSHVTFMGLEMIGHTRINLDEVWIDPIDYQDNLEEAVLLLDRRRTNVSIYNHQLCTLKPTLWRFARKSISDWKNEYLPACEGCSVKAHCGGFFTSSKMRHSLAIRPIPASQSEVVARPL